MSSWKSYMKELSWTWAEYKMPCKYAKKINENLQNWGGNVETQVKVRVALHKETRTLDFFHAKAMEICNDNKEIPFQESRWDGSMVQWKEG